MDIFSTVLAVLLIWFVLGILSSLFGPRIPSLELWEAYQTLVKGIDPKEPRWHEARDALVRLLTDTSRQQVLAEAIARYVPARIPVEVVKRFLEEEEREVKTFPYMVFFHGKREGSRGSLPRRRRTVRRNQVRGILTPRFFHSRF